MRVVLFAAALAVLLGWPAASQNPVPTQDQAAPGAHVPAQIDALLDQPHARRGSWGVCVEDLSTGDRLYARDGDKLFVPASVVKLLTTALALRRLGPDHRFTTAVFADGAVDEDGVLEGDLRIVGGGDPNLSSRVLPFQKREEYAWDRLQRLRPLAQQVLAAGVRKVTGDVVGDSRRYVWQPYTPGWSHADTLQAYGSRPSALVFNDNLIELHVRPGPLGREARLAVTPRFSLFTFANRTRTHATRFVQRGLSTRHGDVPGEVVVWGDISSQSTGRTFELAAQDPARFAAMAMRQALIDAGVAVDGGAASAHSAPDSLDSLRSASTSSSGDPSGGALAFIESLTLADAVRVVNKESQNLHAEMLLREVGLHESGIGSLEAGIANMRRFLAEVGMASDQHFLRDGSGLSRHNLVTPCAMVRLLEHMWSSEESEAFLASLPVAGRDGTLDWRFKRGPARARIRAKTGSMTHVQALAGYAVGAAGSTYAFAILANNFGLSSTASRRLVDEIASAIAGPARN